MIRRPRNTVIVDRFDETRREQWREVAIQLALTFGAAALFIGAAWLSGVRP